MGIDRCFGVTEDDQGRIVTINNARSFSTPVKPGTKGRGGLTDIGETDVFYINRDSGQVVKRIELADIIQDKEKTKCRFLNYREDIIYIVDLGLDMVYTLNTKNNTAAQFGRTGTKTGEFRDPAGLVLDHLGNIIVADSRNHRLQVFNAKGKYQGFVRVDPPVRRPSGIYLDCDEGELYVLNYWGNSMAKYRINV